MQHKNQTMRTTVGKRSKSTAVVQLAQRTDTFLLSFLVALLKGIEKTFSNQPTSNAFLRLHLSNTVGRKARTKINY